MSNNDAEKASNKNRHKPHKNKRRFNRKFNKRKEAASKRPATTEDLLKLKRFFDEKYKHAA